jgi:hypothetical protein
MDDKSTPIESLNNILNDPEVVNKVMTQYNNLQNNNSSYEQTTQLENKFENRDLNSEIYNLQGKNHYKQQQQQQDDYEQDDQYDNDDNENYEYEIIELPLWKRILNELRIPFFIILFIILFFNSYFDKLLLQKIAFFGNKFNECNTYGFLVKTILVAILSYVFIRFIRLS